MIRRVHDPARDVGDVAAAGAIERLDRKHLHSGCDAGDTEAVVSDRGDDPGDVRAVRVVVGRRETAARICGAEHADRREQIAREVGVVWIDAGVDRRNDHRGRAHAEIPRAVHRGHAQSPLTEAGIGIAQIERIVRDEREVKRSVRLGLADAGFSRKDRCRGVGVETGRGANARDAERADRSIDGRTDRLQRERALGRRGLSSEPNEHARTIACCTSKRSTARQKNERSHYRRGDPSLDPHQPQRNRAAPYDAVCTTRTFSRCRRSTAGTRMARWNVPVSPFVTSTTLPRTRPFG